MFITDRGRPAHVLLSIEEYRKLLGDGATLLEAVADVAGSDFMFSPPKLGNRFLRSADLS